MTIAEILEAVDTLSGEELDKVYRRVAERRQAGHHIVPGEQLKALDEIFAPLHAHTEQMSEEEVFAIFDSALDEVRREAAHRRN